MLSSITPLGQRSRGLSWRRAVVAFWVGAMAAGAGVFAVLGVFGESVGASGTGPWIAVLALPVAAVLDTIGVRPPGLRRQVNEDWLGSYRDWVIGLGFGAQLGAGFVTIVPSFGTWALYLIAVGSGTPLAIGLGAGFGFGRSLLLIATRRVGSTTALAGIMQRFVGAEGKARRLSLVGYGLALLGGVMHVA